MRHWLIPVVQVPPQVCPFVLIDSLKRPFARKSLLALMPVLSQSFFTLVRRHFMSFFLLSAWHSFLNFLIG